MNRKIQHAEDQYLERFNELNTHQKKAVKTTEGPVAVIAGPGTGKTELVGMRIANILKTTDTAPENILCLTFTDSGVNAMRQRLLEIIGSEAHKVNIFTFHGFGSTIMTQNLSTFFNDAPFRPASSLTTHEILAKIFSALPHGHILGAKNNGEFINIGRTKTAISNIKQGGLTGEELQKIISDNDISVDKIEKILSPVVAERISAKSIDIYSQAVLDLDKIERTNLPNDTPSLIDTVQKSLLHAISEADNLGKGTPLSTWKKEWFEKDATKKSVLKTRKRQAELKAIKQIYEQYIDAMNKSQLYDYDDMILMTLAALKSNKELLYSLQEQYQYILIDEFQDSNQAQMQIIYKLIDNELNNDVPNILIVGDDDQAIYGFQGADSSNITTFLEKLPKTELITLTDNYRSSQKILDQSRSIITKGENRLENTVTDLDKELKAHKTPNETHAKINSYINKDSEKQAVVDEVSRLISDGVEPNEIAILARKHSQLIDILPFFNKSKIPVAYEKYDNALDLDSIKLLEQLTDFFILLNQEKIENAQALLPEILSHPAWGLEPETLWHISSRAYKERIFWLDALKTIPETTKIYEWFIKNAATITNLSVEQALDVLIGNTEELDGDEFKAPFYNYFFSKGALAENPAKYLLHLNALSAVRNKLREYLAEEKDPTLADFSNFIKLNRTLGESISISQNIATLADKSVHLMTAHKAKGLEFEHVFIIDAIDGNWGSSARSNNKTYKFPENIHLTPTGDSLDERIRLFYVAATRAKKTLNISHSHLNDNGKTTLRTSYLEDNEWEINDNPAEENITSLTNQITTSWSARITEPNQNLKDLLRPVLENYRLNSTVLNNFIDVTYGGPQHFLMQNLLHFPQAPSNDSSYGSAIHHALDQAHLYFNKHKQLKPIEDTIADLETELKRLRIDKNELPKYLDRGANSLTAFFGEKSNKFNLNQKSEVDFYTQQAIYNNVPLTGKMDVFEIDKENKTISITDYKTGKPSVSWKGSSPYEKVKLHKYKQQLMFYRLLIENSRDYKTYTIKNTELSFVEPDKNGEIHTLSAEFSEEEYERFKKLVTVVYQKIVALDLPDISNYQKDINGVIEFEEYLTNS